MEVKDGAYDIYREGNSRYVAVTFNVRGRDLGTTVGEAIKRINEKVKPPPASTVILLRPYKAKYLQQSVRVRDTIFFSYQHGGASLLDFLNAESEYRAVQLNYVNLVGSYLTAAAQLNLAVGREVIQ